MCIAPLHITPRMAFTWRRDLMGRVTIVPCGQCIECRVHKKSAWLGRILLEALAQPSGSRVLSLTYSDASLETEAPGLTLSKHSFDQFIRRYKRASQGRRFFAVGEYGDVSDRPHWHVIIFGDPSASGGFAADLAVELRPWWLHGRVSDDNLTVASAGYVAGYCLKKMSDPRPPLVLSSRRPCGIGLGEIYDLGRVYASALHGRVPESMPGGYTIGGKRYPLWGWGTQTFKQGYLDVGGKLPPESPYEEQRARLVEYLGTHIDNVEKRLRWEAMERDTPKEVRARFRKARL